MLNSAGKCVVDAMVLNDSGNELIDHGKKFTGYETVGIRWHVLNMSTGYTTSK
jgi:hypothetical protein